MKTTIIKGLGVNPIAGLFNRLEGYSSLTLYIDKYEAEKGNLFFLDFCMN